MKLSSLLAGILMLSLGISRADAGTVTLSSVGGRPFASATGVVLPSGVAIRVGTFNLPAPTRDQTLSTTADYAQLKTWFKPLGEGVSGAGSVAQANGSGTRLRANGYPAAGQVFGTIQNVSATYLTPGTQLYVWVFDTANPYDASQWGIFSAAGWVAPPALGAQALSTAAEVQAIQGSVVDGQLRLGTPASTFGNWVMRHFAENAAPGTTGYNADPDGDGIHNIAEYAWKLNPNARESTRTSLTGENSGGSVTFTFKTPRNLADVVVTAECSSDLQAWTPATSTVTATDADFDTHTCNVPAGTGPCFWRVRFATAP